MQRPLTAQITPLLITHDEEANISRTLAKLHWARRIIVVDSGSTDRTLSILAADPRVEVFSRAFTTFADQCNFGLSKVNTDWALSLDADYELSDKIIQEFSELAPSAQVSGFSARFIYRVYGRSLRGSLYPPRTVLYRARHASYSDDGHGHRVSVSGDVLTLRGPIYHDDRKSLARWFTSQQRYARIEAEHLLQSHERELGAADRIRRMGWPAPVLVFLYTLVAKGCLFDGGAGLFYAFQRLLAEVLLALEILDRRLRSSVKS